MSTPLRYFKDGVEKANVINRRLKQEKDLNKRGLGCLSAYDWSKRNRKSEVKRKCRNKKRTHRSWHS